MVQLKTISLNSLYAPQSNLGLQKNEGSLQNLLLQGQTLSRLEYEVVEE